MNEDQYDYATLYHFACAALRFAGAYPFEVEDFAVTALSKFFVSYKKRQRRARSPNAVIATIAIREFHLERKRRKKRKVKEKKYFLDKADKSEAPTLEAEKNEKARLFESLILRFADRTGTRELTIECIKRIHSGETAADVDESLGLPNGKARACWASFLRFVRSVRHEFE